jgi:diguanylate cyclase (GGDEF)-like protein
MHAIEIEEIAVYGFQRIWRSRQLTAQFTLCQFDKTCMKVEFRKLHRKLAPILFFPLLASALTGVAYRLGRDWLGTPNLVADALMKIHQGEYLGEKLVPIYVLLVGLGLVGMSVTGLKLLYLSSDRVSSEQTKLNIRSIHRWLGLILLFPLAISAETGVAYRLGRDWFGISSEQTEIFLRIHQGAYLGSTFSVFYVLMLGMGLVALLIAGIEMTSLVKIPSLVKFFSLVKIQIPRWRWQPRQASPQQLSQNGKQQKDIQAALHESEATSQTILRAIPDSMLHIKQDGTCLSYLPAKGAKSFMLDGDVLGKHLTELLPPEVAHQLIKYARLAFKSGLTQAYQFSTSLDGGSQCYEARLSAIGETEVLVMIRETADPEPAKTEPEQLPPTKGETAVSLLNQQELIQLLEATLEDTKKHDKRHLLCYLAVDRYETICSDRGSQAGDNLLHQVAMKVRSHLPSTYLMARLDSNELALLMHDYSLEKASMLATKLRQAINNFLFRWQGNEYPINVCIGLVEINVNSLDASSVMRAADAACNIAKQKVPSKAFWSHELKPNE